MIHDLRLVAQFRGSDPYMSILKHEMPMLPFEEDLVRSRYQGSHEGDDMGWVDNVGLFMRDIAHGKRRAGCHPRSTIIDPALSYWFLHCFGRNTGLTNIMMV